MNDQLPNFDTTASDEHPAAPPKRQRKASKPPAKPKRAKKAVPKIAAGPKRARKKRIPRRPPGRNANSEVPYTPVAPPIVGPEAAGVIRAYMTLDESSRAVVLAYIQALR